MAIDLIKRTILPVLGRGQLGLPRVRVGENGQIAFSTASSKVLMGCTLAAVGMDSKTRTLQIQGFTKCPKGVDEGDLFKLTYTEKAKAFFFSAASLLQYLKYDYKKSGSQMFDAKVDETKKTVQITLPVGSLKPRDIKPRAAKGEGKAAKANGKAGAVTEPELEADGSGEPEVEELVEQ